MKPSRILQLQSYLKKINVQHIIINRTDEFLGEYIASYAERLNWLTNFSGSAGRAIISQESAMLFVDGRYTNQAKEQINKNEISLERLDNFWTVFKKLYKTKGVLAVDTRLHSIKEISKILQQPESELKIPMGEPTELLNNEKCTKFLIYNKKKIWYRL